jgi:hypothetical protein
VSRARALRVGWAPFGGVMIMIVNLDVCFVVDRGTASQSRIGFPRNLQANLLCAVYNDLFSVNLRVQEHAAPLCLDLIWRLGKRRLALEENAIWNQLISASLAFRKKRLSSLPQQSRSWTCLWLCAYRWRYDAASQTTESGLLQTKNSTSQPKATSHCWPSSHP